MKNFGKLGLFVAKIGPKKPIFTTVFKFKLSYLAQGIILRVARNKIPNLIKK
jgi:hypothetical protein